MALSGFRLEDQCIIEASGDGLKALLTAGMQWLEKYIQILNRLNVFPVPDGDTGTNLFLTMQAAVKNAAGRHAGQAAAAAARGALMGARGNSGVILSQLLQGLAQHLADRPVFSASDFSKAWQLGVKLAYQSVAEPVEGTMLTVAAAAQTAPRQFDDLAELLTAMLDAAKIAQADTPNRLPVLKEAGVTDAGGQGLVYVLTGMVYLLTALPQEVDVAGQVGINPPHDFPPVDYGYDVQFLLYGAGLDVAKIRADIRQMGQSTVVVGDDRLVKVHVHTPDPGRPLSYGARRGALGDVVVENMTRQVAQHALISGFGNGKNQPSGLSKKPVSANNEPVAAMQILAMAPGRGFTEIFNSLGVSHTIVAGGRQPISLENMQTALAGFAAAPVMILPDSIKAFRVAHRAGQVFAGPLHIMPTRTVVQGVVAALAFNSQADADTNLRRMAQAAAEAHTLTITRASRSSRIAGREIQPGEFLAALNGRLVAVSPEINCAALDSFGKIDIEIEIVTLYFGQAIRPAQAEALALEISTRYPDLEIEVHSGAQPYYDYIISLE